MRGPRLVFACFFSCAALLMQPCAATPGQWENTGSLNTGRDTHTATLLLDGRVLVASGQRQALRNVLTPQYRNSTIQSPEFGLRPARLSLLASATPRHCFPMEGCWSQEEHRTPPVSIPANSIIRREAPGTGQAGSILATSITQRPCWPTAGCWSLAGFTGKSCPARNSTIRRAGLGPTGSLNTARAFHTATLLPNGKVLVAGGVDSDITFASAELYDPATGAWTRTGSLDQGRYLHTATLLPNGKVSSQGANGMAPTLLQARNSMIRPPGPGHSPAASTPDAQNTRPRCCPRQRARGGRSQCERHPFLE